MRHQPVHAPLIAIEGAQPVATAALERCPPPCRGRRRPYREDARTKKHARLITEVQQLTLQITRLQQLRELLQEKTRSQLDATIGSLSQTVRMYFDVFSHGYHPQVRLPSRHRSNTNSGDQLLHTNDFLASVMDEDMSGGGFRGVPILIEQWKRFSVLFGGLQLRLLHLQVVPLEETTFEDGNDQPKAMVTATVAHSGHVTLKTIEILFPHILSNAALVMSILGRQVAGDGRTEFIFDCGTGRVVECRIDIDMVGTFVRIVQSPRDLALLFQSALITPEGFVGDTEGIVPVPVPVAQPTAISDTRMAMKHILSEEEEQEEDNDDQFHANRSASPVL